MKLMMRLASVTLALLLVLPTVGCQRRDKESGNERGLDVQVDTGNTKVKVKGSTKPDEEGKHLDVEVEHAK